MAVVRIPLIPRAQRFAITLGETAYNLRITYNDADEAGWVLDLGNAAGDVILAGAPLVTGADLLAQHRHLGIAGRLVVTTDRDAGDVPTFEGLGMTSHLFFVPAP